MNEKFELPIAQNEEEAEALAAQLTEVISDLIEEMGPDEFYRKMGYLAMARPEFDACVAEMRQSESPRSFPI